jgi:hypothetical protein
VCDCRYVWVSIFFSRERRQTETGLIIVTPFPDVIIEIKPGSAKIPFFSIEPANLDYATGVIRSSHRSFSLR